MNLTDILRRYGFPVAGLGILAVLAPELAPGNAARLPSQTQTDQGYRDLWVSDTAGAVTRLIAAVRSDPAAPERWADLADAYTEAGREDLARQCIDRAVGSAPGLPHIQMRAANLSFRVGDTARGLRESAAAVAASSDYAVPVFQAWHRLGGGAENVFREATPPPALARDYFVWLTDSGNQAELAAVWALLKASVTERETLAYIDYLIAGRDYATASSLAGGLPKPDGNLLRDGGFETPLQVGGPTSVARWRVEPMEGVSAELDRVMFRSGHSSLRIHFAGINPEYRNVAQKLVLPQGLYRMTALVRTERVTSEQGISIRLADADDDHHFAVSETVAGDQPWRILSAAFSVGPGNKLVEVAVSRRASWGFDTPLSGTVWVDDIRLVRIREGS